MKSLGIQEKAVTLLSGEEQEGEDKTLYTFVPRIVLSQMHKMKTSVVLRPRVSTIASNETGFSHKQIYYLLNDLFCILYSSSAK